MDRLLCAGHPDEAGVVRFIGCRQRKISEVSCLLQKPAGCPNEPGRAGRVCAQVFQNLHSGKGFSLPPAWHSQDACRDQSPLPPPLFFPHGQSFQQPAVLSPRANYRVAIPGFYSNRPSLLTVPPFPPAFVWRFLRHLRSYLRLCLWLRSASPGLSVEFLSNEVPLFYWHARSCWIRCPRQSLGFCIENSPLPATWPLPAPKPPT